MIALVITILVIVSVLLVLIVLAQDPKSGGFAGGAATPVMGVKKTSDLLEKLTWGFAIGVLVLSIATNFLVSTGEEGINSVNIDRARSAGSGVEKLNQNSGQQATPVDAQPTTDPTAPAEGTPQENAPAPAATPAE